MKRIIYVFILAILLYLVIWLSYRGYYVYQLKKNIIDMYGEDVRDITVQRNIKLATEDPHYHYFSATYQPTDTDFSINYDGKLNSYINDYWEDKMKKVADDAANSIYGNDAHCFKLSVGGRHTSHMPSVAVMSYEEYVNKFCKKENAYIVYKFMGKYNMYSQKFPELLKVVSELPMVYYDITFMFDDVRVSLKDYEVSQLAKNYDEIIVQLNTRHMTQKTR